MITINYALTVKDIQPKNVRCDSNPNNQNKIRRAWVSALSENAMGIIQERIKSAPARHAYYEAIDNEVSKKWIEIMKNSVARSISQGAKFVLDPSGGTRLEDEFCKNTDEHLIAAALIVAETVAEDFNSVKSIPAETIEAKLA